MANPRKFSEKIALHTHRQAEETARFEQIMKEVSDATARPDEVSPHQKLVSYRVGSRARSQGGPIRRPHDRKLDTSPYSSGPFLSPPPDTSWSNRRANSDSALHQSAMQGGSCERIDNSNMRWMVQNMNERHHDGRPRSSCEIPRVPGIHIYHSANIPDAIQIPISGNNTGSLPDLTNVDFSSPISVPLDQEHDQGSSPYSSSPANTSPSTLSPTSMPPGLRPQGRFQFNPTPPHPPHPNHLLVPINSRYSGHRNKNVSMDNNVPVLLDGSHVNDMSNMYQHCPPSSPSPTSSQGANYRSPRPSPQSSPSLGGRHSAPCSPGAPSPLSNDYHVFSPHQATQFQQHFEQLSMMDPPVSYSDQSQQHHQQQSGQMTQAHIQDASCGGNIELTTDGGYYSTSPSQLMYPTAPPSLHTTPNTPTSIPDITLTDFSSAAEDSARHDLVKQFENDNFFTEETLRGSLGSLDFDGFQMLENGTFISDSVEDQFRLDRS